MIIETKYDIDNFVSFYPYGDRSRDPVVGMITGLKTELTFRGFHKRVCYYVLEGPRNWTVEENHILDKVKFGSQTT